MGSLTGLFGRALGVVGFIQARPGGRRVHSGSLGLFWRTLVIVVFIRVGSVHSCAPRGSSDSLGFVGFIRARIEVVRLIPVRRAHSGAPWGRRDH